MPLTGWLLRKQGCDEVWIVLHSSAYRLLLWPTLTLPNSSTVFVDTSTRARPCWESIDDITQWQATNAYTSAVSPADQWFAHAKRPAKTPSAHAIGWSTAGFERLFNAIARVGFRFVEDAQLRKIAKVLKMDFDELPLDKRPSYIHTYTHTSIHTCMHIYTYT